MRHVGCFGPMLLFLFSALAGGAEDSPLPLVTANDNQAPAGRLRNGVLDLRLELRPAVWYPEDEGGVHREVYAFAEEGHAPQSSGPLIRVARDAIPPAADQHHAERSRPARPPHA